jgi:hypothetical protein
MAVQRAFRRQFGRRGPPETSIRRWYEQFRYRGCICYQVLQYIYIYIYTYIIHKYICILGPTEGTLSFQHQHIWCLLIVAQRWKLLILSMHLNRIVMWSAQFVGPGYVRMWRVSTDSFVGMRGWIKRVYFRIGTNICKCSVSSPNPETWTLIGVERWIACCCGT